MKSRTLLYLAPMILAGTVGAQSSERPSAAAATRAAATFYAWYVPIARTDSGPHMRAVRERRTQFSAALVAALRADSVATAQGGEEIDGLDADPFLNAQDACEEYRPVRTIRHGSAYWVDVRGTGGCAAHDEPDVTVAIIWRAARPVFVNFLYSRRPGDDLLAHLHELADRRRRATRTEH